MKNIKPQNNYLLCVEDGEISPDTGNIAVQGLKSVKIYRIIDAGAGTEAAYYKSGERIIVNATGTKLVDMQKTFYVFDAKTVIAKIED